MKKYVLVFVLFFAVCGSSFGQYGMTQSFNHLFGYLEEDRVPHGILLDYAMVFTDVEAFDGTLTDSTYIDMLRLKKIYHTLLMGVIDPTVTSFVTPNDFDARLRDNRSADFIALTGLYFKYSKFADNALSTRKVGYGIPYPVFYTLPMFYDLYTDGYWSYQAYVPAGDWINPYEEKQTFALTPAIKRYRGLELKVKIPSEIFYSNSQNQVEKIEIDFGAGYIKVPFDKEIAIQYPFEGLKTWKYKLTLTDGTEMYSQSEIKIEKTFKKLPLNIGGIN